MGIWQIGGWREVYWNIKERREEREILEYGRDMDRERSIVIWKRGGKREEYGNMAERRE